MGRGVNALPDALACVLNTFTSHSGQGGIIFRADFDVFARNYLKDSDVRQLNDL